MLEQRLTGFRPSTEKPVSLASLVVENNCFVIVSFLQPLTKLFRTCIFSTSSGQDRDLTMEHIGLYHEGVLKMQVLNGFVRRWDEKLTDMDRLVSTTRGARDAVFDELPGAPMHWVMFSTDGSVKAAGFEVTEPL